MNVTCPSCDTTYRIDPRKVPAAGVRARCTECSGIFAIQAESPERPAFGVEPESGGGGGTAVAEAPAAVAAPPAFGASDPDSRARRLARALVSDIVVYHPDRRARSASAGTLRQEFRQEIQKSWEEYAAQVGAGFARETPYFREALNEILAGGERIF